MMYLPDCLRATIELLEAPEERLRLRTYNINALSVSPDELANELKKIVPHFKIEYDSEPDFRQEIGMTFCLVSSLILKNLHTPSQL